MRLMFLVVVMTFCFSTAIAGEIYHMQDLGEMVPSIEELTDQWIADFESHPSTINGAMPSEEIPNYINSHTGVGHGCISFDGYPCVSGTGEPPIGIHPDSQGD